MNANMMSAAAVTLAGVVGGALVTRKRDRLGGALVGGMVGLGLVAAPRLLAARNGESAGPSPLVSVLP